MNSSNNQNIEQNYYINDKNALQLHISELISRIDHLEKRGQFDEAHKYIKNVSYITSKLSMDGVFTDPLTNKKYYLSMGKLRGGLPTYAHECVNFKKANLYQQNNNEEIVFKELKYLLEQRKWLNFPGGAFTAPPTAGIFIQNRSKYVLEYCSSGSENGYFFTSDVQDSAFQGENRTIKPDHTAGFMHTVGGASFGAPCGNCNDISKK